MKLNNLQEVTFNHSFDFTGFDIEIFRKRLTSHVKEHRKWLLKLARMKFKSY